MKKKKAFSMGRLSMTDRVHEAASASSLFYRFAYGCIGRHKYRDWGDCCEHDKQCNDYNQVRGGRLFSSYNLPSAVCIPGESRIWIITEADRQNTTVLFPSDY